MSFWFKKPQSIQAVYLYLVLGNTLAASFIWGINTIFLLSAGLSNFEAFAVNACFTAGEVLFEIPTGVVADTWGRRASYLLGCITLTISTLLYYFMWKIHGPFWGWVASSVLLGLGFTFFSGALEAWLVDALHATGFRGSLDKVFGRAQVAGGGAMLIGSVAGGLIAQFTNLGVPYIVRAGILIINFLTAFFFMKDLGFSPRKSQKLSSEVKSLLRESVDNGLKKPGIRWIMLAAPFISGVSFYVFYALQPHLLKLYGNQRAYLVAGLVAALAAGAQVVGGFLVPYLKQLFSKRTNAMSAGIFLAGISLAGIAVTHNFYIALVFIFSWGLIGAAVTPIRQAYLNGLIPSEQRATVLSFDSLMGSSGGVFIQPALGKIADAFSYSASFAAAAVLQIVALPFVLLAKRTKPESDAINGVT